MIKYDEYVTYINSVVNNTIRNGLEFKRFWQVLSYKMIFEKYQPKHILETGEVDIGAEWDEIADADIYNGAVDTESMYEMIEVINKKLDVYYRRNKFDDALSDLLNTASEFIKQMQDKFSKTDINSAIKDMKELNDTIKLYNLDSNTMAKVLTEHAIEKS